MLKNYFIITLKVLARRKFFTFVSLFGISFTLMILVVATAFIDHSFAPMKPESKFDRVVTASRFRMRSPDKNSNWQSQAGYYVIEHYMRPLWSQMPDAIESFSIFTDNTKSSTFRNGQKIEFDLRKTDGHYFNIVDLEFVEGAPYTQEDEEKGSMVIILNEATKRKYFGEGEAVGKDFIFDGRSFRVVGVVKNVPEIRTVAFSDAWAPISTNKSPVYRNTPTTSGQLMGDFSFSILATDPSKIPMIRAAVWDAIARVEMPEPKDYSTLETIAQTRFQHIASQLFRDWENYYTKDQSSKLMLAFIISAFVFMLLPSLNLINLNLSRMMERSSEVGVRRAFGAPTGSLLIQFIVENIFLSIMGGAIGFVLSVLGLYILNKSNLIVHANFGLNFKVFALGFLISVLFGVLSGVYPAWRMSRLNPVSALKGVK